MIDDWLEADEAAQLLGRTPRQLLRYAEAGKIATRRIGRRFQYRRDDVERLASEVEANDTTRRDGAASDVGRALLEVLNAQRQVIELQREVMDLRQQIALLEQQRQAYIRIIGELRKRAT